MKIRIIEVGATKDSYIKDGIWEYQKRLSPFTKIEVITLKEISRSKTFPVQKCVEIEGEQILRSLPGDSFLIALDEKGKEFRSVEFSNLLKTKMDVGKSITFIIGGPFGISKSVKDRVHMEISLSKMTFTHQMIRVFLLEQIYRAICIIRGKEYHIA